MEGYLHMKNLTGINREFCDYLFAKMAEKKGLRVVKA
jgi:hypothetical protein